LRRADFFSPREAPLSHKGAQLSDAPFFFRACKRRRRHEDNVTDSMATKVPKVMKLIGRFTSATPISLFRLQGAGRPARAPAALGRAERSEAEVL
jgi:hypothetical protein